MQPNLLDVYEFCFYKSGRREIIIYIFCIATEQGFLTWSLWMSFRGISNILKLFPKWWCRCIGSINTPRPLSMKRVVNFYPVLKCVCERKRLGTKMLCQSQRTRAFFRRKHTWISSMIAVFCLVYPHHPQRFLIIRILI